MSDTETKPTMGALDASWRRYLADVRSVNARQHTLEADLAFAIAENRDRDNAAGRFADGQAELQKARDLAEATWDRAVEEAKGGDNGCRLYFRGFMIGLRFDDGDFYMDFERLEQLGIAAHAPTGGADDFDWG